VSVVELPTAPPISSEFWDRFEVPEAYLAEIVRGELVVTPAPTVLHGFVQIELGALLREQVRPPLRVASGVEWRCDERGVVAMAPQPDLVVIHRKTSELWETPALAVEILSPSDSNRLDRSRLTRIEGKRLDYAERGLRDYLEVDLSGEDPVLIRYELRDGELVACERVVGEETLVATRPFAYRLTPTALVQGADEA
jgi:Uma2 family endonuclease